MEEVEGIIIDEKSYSETSKLLYIITKEHGLISVISKGCKNIKSSLRNVSSRLTYANFIIHYKEGKLSTLKEASIINSFKNIKKDINKISYSAYLLELSGGVIKQNNNPFIFENLKNALIKIDEGYDPLVIMNIVELKFLDYLGVMPIIDECSLCGKKTGIVTLSSYRGGYVCDKCYTNEIKVSDKTIKLIRMFYYVDIAKITKLDVSKQSKYEINKFLDDYYSRYTGLYLKSKTFIQNLQRIGQFDK